VLLVGLGGLGSPAALYLAAAGVGTLGLVDADVVDLSNLQRQVIHGTSDIGRSKLASAAARIAEINPHVAVEQHAVRLTSANALGLLARYDIIVDGSDNFPTRYLVNDACALLGKPDVYGSIYRFEGQAAVFDARRGPCYRCLYRDPPPPELVPSCAEGGVFGVLPGIVGSIQAVETIKLILGAGEALVGRLLIFDALAMRFRSLELEKDPACPLCGPHPAISRLIDYDAFCGVAPQPSKEPVVRSDVSVQDVKAQLDAQQVVIVDVREQWEWDLCHIAGARHIPLATLPDALASLPKDAELVTVCHGGSRSRQAAHYLIGSGFEKARSMAGGMRAWATEIDTTMPQY
jgi:molybdopterin/thiamine biosynthesis adenylyltransferase/rhodanese-related sulfurtransferase